MIRDRCANQDYWILLYQILNCEGYQKIVLFAPLEEQLLNLGTNRTSTNLVRL
jgi:hypothetical protein